MFLTSWWQSCHVRPDLSNYYGGYDVFLTGRGNAPNNVNKTQVARNWNFPFSSSLMEETCVKLQKCQSGGGAGSDTCAASCFRTSRWVNDEKITRQKSNCLCALQTAQACVVHVNSGGGCCSEALWLQPALFALASFLFVSRPLSV